MWLQWRAGRKEAKLGVMGAGRQWRAHREERAEPGGEGSAQRQDRL